MTLQITSTKQPVHSVSFMGDSVIPWGDSKARVFRAYQGNEALAHRLRTGAKGELLIVNKSKLTEVSVK